MAEAETKEAHTPGPWMAASGECCDDGLHVCTERAEGAYVCGQLDNGGISRFEAEANARLLAAAPELLAALKDCLGWHDYADDMHKPIEVRAAYMRARAAIQRAEA